MHNNYDFQAVEAEAQTSWSENKTFVASEDDARPKYYSLCMLPYPSGTLHMGHVRNYTIGDVISRFKRMQGFNVMQPMGWDAFGMPAENAAIERNVHPAQWTYNNIASMKVQLQRLGLAYDWSREVMTCRPDYYRWEQWFFTQLMERGLAYKKLGFVNWCETDQTVLANEQVEEGCCWRCKEPVERREIEQWFLKITDYAEELLNGLDDLSGWPESVKTMQRNWIGRSEGVEFDWRVADDPHSLVRVYTTRPDTVMGVTFMAVAAEHPLVHKALAKGNPELAAFVDDCARQGTSEAVIEALEKKGMPIGIDVIHPVTGDTVPVWVGNYVLITYGGGAVMGVPGHDQRDYDFAKKYALPITQVVTCAEGTQSAEEAAFTGKNNTVSINSGQFDGLNFEDCFNAVADYLQEHAGGARKVNYRLRDWLVSRQRYWGCPIPVIYDEQGEAHGVPESQLPVTLPEDVTFTGVVSPLKTTETFLQATVPGTDQPGRRETDTFDTFFESSWYYARYCCPDAESMLDARANYWLPIDQYIGGIEHAVMHLLYFRFFHKLMRDIGLVDSDEPCKNLLTQGMVISETFYREINGRKKYYYPHEVDMKFDDKGRIVGAVLMADNQQVEVGKVEKMSKSKNNGVDPEAMIGRFGADTLRLFSMFAAPPEQSLEWRESGVEGMQRFLRRLWRQVADLCTEGSAAPVQLPLADSADQDLRRKAHETLQKVTDDYARRYTFNTAIAAIMELSNAVQGHANRAADGPSSRAVRAEALRLIVQMLAPITPHICHSLWQNLGGTEAIADVAWPEVDEAALVRAAQDLVVQVNGKLRGKISVPLDASKDECIAAARAEENVARFLADTQTIKEVYVPGRLVNLVVR